MKRTIRTIAIMAVMTFGLSTLPACGEGESATTEENHEDHDHDHEGEDHEGHDHDDHAH